MHAVEKYLTARAEPEARLAAGVEVRYERAVVVPACREHASLLDGYVGAAAASKGRTLMILVVNGRTEASELHHGENASLLRALRASLSFVRELDPSAFVGSAAANALDVLVVDRASPGRRFPPKAGVGLARKIGIDLALALHAAGKVRSPFVFSGDADVVLPDAHFERPESAAETAGALVFPFWHDTSDDAAVTRATALYELSLRYYVAGLAAAGSPYAFHTLGSAMAVDARAYAAVRGVPQREAGEDFYLLGKIAKVMPLVRAKLPEIRIRSRVSDRTPFGTGAGVLRGMGGAERLFYAPEIFGELGRFLDALDALSEHASFERFFEAGGGLGAREWTAVERALLDGKGRESLTRAARDASSERARRIRLHDWFDAFRTLKFVHALRDAVWPSISCREALERAPFVPPSASPDDVDASRAAFFESEQSSPAVFGPRRMAE